MTPKAQSGPVEAVRQLRVALAPDAVPAQLVGLPLKRMVAVAERWRPGDDMTVDASARRALRSVARRWRSLDDEARTLRTNIRAILNDIAPDLLAVHGVGDHTAGQLFVTAGDNPDRLHHETSFAALCGSTPVAASSGKTRRHRLNRGGDRQANSALWTIVRTRTATHPPTIAYVNRRTADGLSKPDIMRCLKRYVARELFPLIRNITNNTTTNESAA